MTKLCIFSKFYLVDSVYHFNWKTALHRLFLDKSINSFNKIPPLDHILSYFNPVHLKYPHFYLPVI
jgi:hypothetical protein